jgi:multimeric flavodoxin WrbA
MSCFVWSFRPARPFLSFERRPTIWHHRVMPVLLVVHHSPTRSLRALTDAVVAGAHDDSIEGVEVVVRDALDFARGTADHADLLGADGYVLGTTANFGYMSGALKHVFDSTFLQVGGALSDDGSAGSGGSATARRPFGLYVHGRYDTTGAVRSVLSITGALGWKQGYDVLEAMGDLTEEHTSSAYELGGTIAALLAQ